MSNVILEKKQKRRILFCRVCTGILLMLFLLFIALGIWIDQAFDRQMPNDLLELVSVRESPHFYVYDFTDRANREGECREVTAGSFSAKSGYIAYSEIPKAMIDAVVSIEDKRFFSHNGVDWYRTAAASVNYLLGSSKHFGGSGITQQLVKNLTGRDEVSPKRKLQEILHAVDLEQTLDKSEILELYLNVVCFSDNCTGIGAAAEHYFSKAPQELTVAECASIAAITNSPAYYNPIRHPENNRARRDLILSEMYAQGYLNDSAYQSALAEPLSLHVAEGAGAESNSWYVDMVIEDVIDDLMEKYEIGRSAASGLVYGGGLRIEMAMDEATQERVEEYYRTAVKTPINDKGIAAQSALIVIDSRTGDVLGVAGAVGEKRGNRLQNFATQTKRPPGSVLKPLSVYAPALEKGIINWASVYDDVPVDFGKNGTTAWPRNATGAYRGLTNVAYAVAHSTNTVAVRILQELGLKESYSFAKDRFHLSGMVSRSGANDCDLAALALGQLNYGVTLRELTTAYTVFADGGSYHPWRSYYRVLDARGNILLSCPDRSETVLSEGNAAVMTKLLQGVVRDGTSSSVTLGRLVECAGKTGTTNADGDRWFVGYTPDLICGVWCGYEYPEPLTGRNLCTKIWNDVMWELEEGREGRKSFLVPSSVIQVSFCRDSGRLEDDACLADPRGTRRETGWFVRGTEPSLHCDRHVLCEYDRESGGISHGNCPHEVCEKIGLVRVERSFPMQVIVADAQYAFVGDPLSVPPNPDTTQAYFEGENKEYHGASAKKTPFNASCTFHTEPPEELDEWSYLAPSLFPRKKE